MSNPFASAEDQPEDASAPTNPFDASDEPKEHGDPTDVGRGEQEEEDPFSTPNSKNGVDRRCPIDESFVLFEELFGKDGDDIDVSLTLQEASDMIGPAYFTEAFDHSTFCLSLPSDGDPAFFAAALHQQQAALDSISSALYEKVQRSSGAFMTAMKQIEAVHRDSGLTVNVCGQSRQRLFAVDETMVKSGLHLLRMARRRHRIRLVLARLLEARDVLDKVARVKMLIAEGDYPSALSLAEDLQQTAKVDPMRVLRGLAREASDMGSKMEERLSEALERVCAHYSQQEWERVLTSFQLLGGEYAEPRAIAMRAHAQCLALAETSAHALVVTYVLREAKYRDQVEQLQQAPLKQVARMLEGPQLVECLHQVFGQLCFVMRGHAQMSCHPSPVGAGLKKFRSVLWEECQNRAVSMIKTRSALGLKMVQLLRVRQLTERLAAAGEQFAGEPEPGILRKTLKAQLQRYFKVFHKSRLSDLVAAVEREAWEPLTVAAGYGAQDVKEVRLWLRDTDQTIIMTEQHQYDVDWEATEWTNPMGEQLRLTPEDAEDDEEDEDEEYDSALFQDQVEDDGDDSVVMKRVVSAEELKVETISFVAINTMRHVGRYCTLITGMPEIAASVWKALQRLADYHLYATYYLFVLGQGKRDPRQVLMSPTMRSMLSKIHRDSIQPDQVPAPDSEASSQSEVWRDKARELLAKTTTSLHDGANSKQDAVMMGSGGAMLLRLPPRRSDGMPAAVEVSRVNVGIAGQSWFAKTMKELSPKCLAVLPVNLQRSARAWLDEMASVSDELSALAWEGCAERLLPSAPTIDAILDEAWAKQGTDRAQAPYASKLVKRLRAFHQQLGPQSASSRQLWTYVVSRVMDVLLEGYGKVRKCSDDGRTLMMLDFRTMVSDLERIAPIKPLPGVERVRNYIQAYFFKEGVASWIQDYHYQYSLEQLQGLVNVAAARMKRRDRQALLAKVEGLKTPPI